LQMARGLPTRQRAARSVYARKLRLEPGDAER